MLTDYVPGSQLVFTRNPNYWETDPTGPWVKATSSPIRIMYRQLIIPDLSTRQAAFRTGRLDDLNAFTREDYTKNDSV